MHIVAFTLYLFVVFSGGAPRRNQRWDVAQRDRLQGCSGRRIRAPKQSGAVSFILFLVRATVQLVQFRATMIRPRSLPRDPDLLSSTLASLGREPCGSSMTSCCVCSNLIAAAARSGMDLRSSNGAQLGHGEINLNKSALVKPIDKLTTGRSPAQCAGHLWTKSNCYLSCILPRLATHSLK
jgi:hypothetical protein